MKTTGLFISAILFSVNSFAADTKSFFYNIDPSRVEATGPNGENSGVNLYPLQIKVDNEMVVNESYKSDDGALVRGGFATRKYDAGAAASAKGHLFTRVLDLAKREKSNVKIYKNDNGFAWIEPTDARVRDLAANLMSWDNKEGTAIKSIDSELVTYSGCSENGFNIYVMGRFYGRQQYDGPKENQQPCFEGLQKLKRPNKEELITITPTGKTFNIVTATDQTALKGLQTGPTSLPAGNSTPATGSK